MTVRDYLCGTSKSVYNSPRGLPKQPDDRAPVRLRTALHLGTAAAPHGFRVVAVAADGGQALVCLGRTRDEALLRARKVRLPRGAKAVLLQEWKGGARAGAWERLPCHRGELPAVHVRSLRRLWRRKALAELEA